MRPAVKLSPHTGHWIRSAAVAGRVPFSTASRSAFDRSPLAR